MRRPHEAPILRLLRYAAYECRHGANLSGLRGRIPFIGFTMSVEREKDLFGKNEQRLSRED